eukprot:gnl/MRDRNA2_/MRDRNA2_135504_c0_seq1.p1 gnl/MRDRNA2_/MRDRNA2_135504_c0~~gnl/MRDRNA2_/MRDRNA2_135504_c0_seq1.p1  ORF type:complete len:311 (-),score=62.27 gnl/MRDRNA2_/MRDRNA2_135504_c0_seq1:9-941(-)
MDEFMKMIKSNEPSKKIDEILASMHGSFDRVMGFRTSPSVAMLEKLEHANELLKKGHFVEAARNFRIIISEISQIKSRRRRKEALVMAKIGLVKCLARVDSHHEELIRLCTAMLEEDENDTWALFQRGSAWSRLASLGNKDTIKAAEADLSEVIRMSPKSNLAIKSNELILSLRPRRGSKSSLNGCGEPKSLSLWNEGGRSVSSANGYSYVPITVPSSQGDAEADHDLSQLQEADVGRRKSSTDSGSGAQCHLDATTSLWEAQRVSWLRAGEARTQACREEERRSQALTQGLNTNEEENLRAVVQASKKP